MAKADESVETPEIAGHTVRITHPEKLYFSRQVRLTKLDIARYFLAVAPGALRGDQARQVRDFFARAHGEIEEMLESTSKLLSGLTAWTGVVVPPTAADVAIRSIQVVGLAPATVLAVAVLADGSVEKHTIELAGEVGEERVNAASAHLATVPYPIVIKADGLAAGKGVIIPSSPDLQASH